VEAGPDGAGNNVGNPQQRLTGSGYVVYPEMTALWQGEPGALHCRDIPVVELGRAALDEQMLHPKSMQRTDQRRQARCACSFLINVTVPLSGMLCPHPTEAMSYGLLEAELAVETQPAWSCDQQSHGDGDEHEVVLIAAAAQGDEAFLAAGHRDRHNHLNNNDQPAQRCEQTEKQQ